MKCPTIPTVFSYKTSSDRKVSISKRVGNRGYILIFEHRVTKRDRRGRKLRPTTHGWLSKDKTRRSTVINLKKESLRGLKAILGQLEEF